jgi:hypothetical protein
MANLIKTDGIESALIGAGVDPSSDEAIAIREAVRGGESLDAAIEAFAPTPSAALATQSAAPVAASGKKRKTKEAKQIEIKPQRVAASAGDDVVESIASSAWERGVSTAHEYGQLAREEMLNGFRAQAEEEVVATEQFCDLLGTSFAGMLGVTKGG